MQLAIFSAEKHQCDILEVLFSFAELSEKLVSPMPLKDRKCLIRLGSRSAPEVLILGTAENKLRIVSLTALNMDQLSTYRSITLPGGA